MTITKTPTYKSIDGYKGYLVGDDGSVWSMHDFHGGYRFEWKRLKPRPDKDGYLSVTLYRNTKRKTIKVAHLVLEAFVCARPAGAVSRHCPDPDVKNNNASNLQWGTQAENIADKMELGTVARGSKHGSARLSESDVHLIRKARESGTRVADLAQQYGVSKGHIYGILRGKFWAHLS